MGSGSSQTTTASPSITQTSSSPWGPQQSYLTNAWQAAQNNYNSQSSTPYTGSYSAGPTQGQYDAYGNAVTQANNQQSNVNGQLNLGTNESNSGYSSTLGALNGLGSFTNSNNAQNLGSQASQIASGYNVPAEVQAATNQAQQLANQTSIPNLYRTSAAGGDINSSQSALEQGAIEAALATNAQTLGTTLQNQNYGTSLTNAQNQNSQNLNAIQSQGTLGLGLNSGGTNNTNSGITNQTALNQQSTGGANGIQNLNQLTDTSNLANYLGPQSLSNQQLNQLYSIIGSGQWGGQGTSVSSGTSSTQQSNPSVLSSAGSLTGILGSLLGNGSTNTGVVGSLGSVLK